MLGMKEVLHLVLKSNEEAIEIILTAILKAGYKAGKDIFLAMDAAVTEMF